MLKLTTIRFLLLVAITNHWYIKQIDVQNAFLNGILIEDVYMRQSPGYLHSDYPNHLCKLNKSLYGLRQAPHSWFSRLT